VQRGEPFEAQFLRWLVDFWAMEFLGYWAIVTVLYMIQYRRESRWQAIQAAQLQASLTEARLQALRAQLNPHFIFNTLNSISVLALRSQATAVVEMLSRLSDLLRVALDDRGPQEIPLARELEFLDAYLEIQHLRFGDRMTVK
jgi:two-component system LytT family sensor kinase